MHLAFSSMNTPNDPAPAELAKALEERGFESLWYGEHSHIPCCRSTAYPAGGELPEPYCNMMDPYLSLMTAANATSKLRLGTGIALHLQSRQYRQLGVKRSLRELIDGAQQVPGKEIGRGRTRGSSGRIPDGGNLHRTRME